MKLSPLTSHRMAFLSGLLVDSPMRDPKTALTVHRQRAERVTVWECPICGERHDDEEDAEDCCQGAEQAGDDGANVHCPVCGLRHDDHNEAADCCLWKDIPAPARWRIAARVEASHDESMLVWVEAVRAEGFEL